MIELRSGFAASGEAFPPELGESGGVGGRRRLDAGAISAARVSNAIGMLVVVLVVFAGAVAAFWLAGLPSWIDRWIFPAAAVLSIGLFLWSHLWIAVAIRRIRYRVDERGMEIVRGVIWRHVVAVPRSRVQHTDVAQGPVQRRYGVATLTLHTAGTQNSSVELAGLPHEAALEIRDFLVQESGSDDAV